MFERKLEKKPSSKMVKLESDAEGVSEKIKATITANLESFKENHPSLFLQFAIKCKKSNQKMSENVQKAARKHDLVTADGEIHDVVKNIVLSNIHDLDVLLSASQPSVKSSPEEDLFFLCFAAEDMERINKLLSIEGINVNKQFHLGETCLIRAARRGNIALVKALLEKGADESITDFLGNTPARVAPDEIKELLNSRKQESVNHVATMPISTFHRSNQSSQKTIIQRLEINNTSNQMSSYKKHEPIYDESNLFHKNVGNSSPPRSVIIISPKEAEDELMNLCFHGSNNIEKIEELLSIEGVNINRQFALGNTYLIQAARKGHIEIVRLLLEKGANKDIENFIGQTPESVASSSKIKELINSWNVTKEALPAQKIN